MKVRHAYDLHKLLAVAGFADFFKAGEFIVMLLKVGQDDVANYKSNNKWLRNHPKDVLIFKDLENAWEQMKEAYDGQLKAVIFGDDFPTAYQILETFRQIKNDFLA